MHTASKRVGQFAGRIAMTAAGLVLWGWFCLHGQRAGWFDASMGVALFASSFVVVFADIFLSMAGSLRRAEAERGRLSAAIDMAAEMVVITDAEGSIQYVNPAFTVITGYARAEALGQNPRFLKSGTLDAAFYHDLWKTISGGRTWRGSFANKKKDGTLYTSHVTISPVRDDSGAIINYAAVERDISRELALEEQARQSQKMETIGHLIGGVAHDFNNLLQAILSYCEILLQETPPHDPRYDHLTGIEKAGNRAAELTRQLLTVGRKQDLVQRATDINVLIADLNKMLRRIIGKNIVIESDFAPQLDHVLVESCQIGQILINLAVNARDAMPDGGRIIFKTSAHVFSEADAAAQPEIRPGRYACVSVTDTGTGIPPEILDKIFQPFFTTKGSGKGTGLGLATSQGIASQHGGWLGVSSEVGAGSSFKLYLPFARQSEEPVADAGTSYANAR